MIYYRHWGHDQAQCLKIIHGANNTIRKVHDQFHLEHGPINIIEELSQYNGWHRLGPWFWQNLTDSLLEELGGIPMEIDMVWTKNPLRRLADNTRQPISFYLKIRPNKDQVRAMDAIIALL